MTHPNAEIAGNPRLYSFLIAWNDNDSDEGTYGWSGEADDREAALALAYEEMWSTTGDSEQFDLKEFSDGRSVIEEWHGIDPWANPVQTGMSTDIVEAMLAEQQDKIMRRLVDPLVEQLKIARDEIENMLETYVFDAANGEKPGEADLKIVRDIDAALDLAGRDRPVCDTGSLDQVEAALAPASGVPVLVAALQKIIASAPADEPEPEDYDDTESAYGNGIDVAGWEAAEIAREAMKAFRNSVATDLTVVLEGGIVTAVVSAGALVGMQIGIIDYDTDDAEPGTTVPIPQDGGDVEEAYFAQIEVIRSGITIPRFTEEDAERAARAAGWAWDEDAREYRLNDTGEGYDDICPAPSWRSLCLRKQIVVQVGGIV